ncbi:hypothetical protein EIN_079820 [Entamoeba invadens IP1]|uniref:hypothetical protein n=1 Tax=Entamoeba invadens IP1 TaxID=370355 RepID=UPI0002C3D745|nr:hypothetical protein EIN_079820 [Entamoeba invadens IP1]ELP85040.1 hypothetical protein EIN_079820 [Entamoeba invadens IP1]|eukprot:XP_004184386.1 hypothetical protein EIN_079820 [Entamoeba invadens IP1]
MGFFNDMETYAVKLWNGVVLSLFYVVASYKKSLKPLCVGISTVFLAVCFLCVLQSAVSQVPSVFMRLSETQIGEGDILLVSRNSPFVNYTNLTTLLDTCNHCSANFPRWLFVGDITGPARTATCIMNIYNSTLEKEIDIGRGWEYDPLAPKSVVLSKDAAAIIGAKEGQNINLTLDFVKIFNGVGANISQITDIFTFERNVTTEVPLPLSVVDPTNSKNGKVIILTIYNMEKTINETTPVDQRSFSSIYIEGIDMYITEAYNTYVLDILKKDPYDQFIIKNDSLITQVEFYIKVDGNTLMSKMNITEQMYVKGVTPKPYGKYSQVLGNVISIDKGGVEIIMEDMMKTIVDDEIKQRVSPISQFVNTTLITEYINKQLDQNFKIDIGGFATQLYVQMKDRTKAYFDGDKLMQSIVIDTTNEIASIIGVDQPYTITAPLSQVVSVFNYLMYLLQQIFNFILVVFAFMSGLLIYSLLISDVEEKTYEFGMLRALGLLKALLIEILVTESALFSSIGIVTGLVLGYLFSLIVNYLISYLSAVPMTFIPVWQSIVLPFLLGLILPVVSNIVPIRRVLSKTLRNSLDLYHSAANEVNVTIKRIEDIGMSPLLIMISIIMIIASFITYYLVPLSFLNTNFTLLFTCFLIVLLAFLAGLCLLSQIFQPWMQTIIRYIIITPFQSALLSIVGKNLDSHSARNTKTTLILTITISFVLFAGAAFSLSQTTLTNVIRQQLGADVQVKNTVGTLDKDLLESYLSSSSHVESYSFMTSDFATTANKKAKTYLSNLAMYPNEKLSFIAVDANFSKTVFTDLLVPVQTDNTIQYEKADKYDDVIKSLYDSPRARPSDVPTQNPINTDTEYYTKYGTDYYYKNYSDVIVAEGILHEDSMSVGDNVRIQVLPYTDSNKNYFLGKIRASLKSMPGAMFSSFYSVGMFSPVIITTDQLQELLDVERYLTGTANKVTYSTCFVKVKKGVSDVVVQEIRTLFGGITISVQDTESTLYTITSSMKILEIFFVVVSLIAMALCFFVMLLSFTANVRENSWEFAVLRAVGLTKWKVITIYIYEAFCITLSSVIFGTLIGIGVACLVNLQFILFLQLPFVFAFPWINAVVVYVLAFVVSFAASFIPSYALTRKPISNVLKGQI